MGEFRMPSLGADMERGTLLEWLVKPGDHVAKGDIVAVVDTEKSDIEVEVFESGVVSELLVEEGDEVPVGTPLARIDSGLDSTRPATTAPGTDSAPGGLPPGGTLVPQNGGAANGVGEEHPGRVLSPLVRHLAEERHLDVAHLHGSGPGGVVTRHDVEAAPGPPAQSVPGPPARRTDLGDRLRASPLARRRAGELGLDLAGVAGSGPDGAVLAGDLRAAPARSTAPPAEVSTRAVAEPDGMRRVIAAAMARSKREIPHYYLDTTVDLTTAVEWLREYNEDRPVTERILPVVLLLKATALSAAEHPEVNGHWIDGHRPASSVHLGVAISLRGGGLVAPGIADAQDRSLGDLMAALRDLTRRARAGRLRQSEWTGPTITVTNLGDLGVDGVLGVINPAQLAMVGFGAVHDAVLAVDGRPAVRTVVRASLAADHRASDGMQGAAFLASVARRLQEPEAL